MTDEAVGQPQDFESDLERRPCSGLAAVNRASGTPDPTSPDPENPDPTSLVHQLADRSAVDRELHRFRNRLAQHRRSHLDLLDDIVAADRIELWMADGAPSMIEWLSWSHGMNRHTARTSVTVAHALGDLPALRTAYAAGVLSWDQLRAAVDVATPETDAALAVQVAQMTPTEIRALARRITDEAEEAAVEARELHYWFHEKDPVFEMHMRLPDVEGAALITALRRRASIVDANPVDGLSYDHSVRMADALTQLASQYLASDADHDRATLVVRTDIPTLLAATDDPDDDSHHAGHQQSLLGDSSVLPDHLTITNRTLRRLACDARIQLALEDPQDGVIGIGRTSRTIPPWLARIVRSRDGGCRFPDCERRHWLVIHHIQHWVDGGVTDLTNLITLCGFHHRLIHNHNWNVVGNPNHPDKAAVRWFTKWGTRFERHPRPEAMYWIRQVHANAIPSHPPRVLRDMLHAQPSNGSQHPPDT